MANVTSVLSAHKGVPYLYEKMHSKFIEKSVSGKLSFADARHVLGSEFKVHKSEYFAILKELSKFGLIKINCYHSIQLREKLVLR